MKKKFTRLTCLLLALLMFVTLFSCAKSENDDGKGSEADDLTKAEAETTATPEQLLGFEFKKFGGEMNFMADRQIMFQVCDIFVEEDSADPIDSAIFNRNIWINDNFDVNVIETPTEDVMSFASSQFKAGSSDCDAYASKTTYASQMSTKGYLTDFFGDKLEYVNLEHSWWDSKSVEGLQVNGKLYYATGDLFTVDNSATYIMMFNKTLVEDKNLENPYELVKNYEWTTAKMKELGTQVAFSKDSTADYYKYNSFGFAGGCEMVLAFFYAAGMRSVKTNDNNELEFALDIEKTVDYLTWAHDTLYDKEFSVIYHELPKQDAALTRQAFSEGRVLFYGEVLGTVQGLRESDVVFGVIPFPMYYENQHQYYAMVNNVAHVVSVPVNCSNAEKSSMIIEAMAYKSQSTLTPAYYDITLVAKGLRDAESEPMLDLILQNRIYDLGYVFGWGQMLEPNFYNSAKAGTGTVSGIEKQKKTFEKQMKNTLKAYDNFDY